MICFVQLLQVFFFAFQFPCNRSMKSLDTTVMTVDLRIIVLIFIIVMKNFLYGMKIYRTACQIKDLARYLLLSVAVVQSNYVTIIIIIYLITTTSIYEK